MKLNLDTFRDKVNGCWTGKNIGGTFGAPFEGLRQVNQTDFYIQDLSGNPPSNDDLDLQLVWLSAVERHGRAVNASILGEYWISYVIPNWVEYGTGKANLKAGLLPPLSGYAENVYRNSCGCFIRSEIWACLAPGHPELAARYAFEDAIVDHAEEGVFGEIFCAALQSAAFAEKAPAALIEIALSYIPEDCSVTKAVRAAQECYARKTNLLDARKLIHNTAPGTFGLQASLPEDIQRETDKGMALGEPGFDAPENIAFLIAGWLYGEGDFGRSLMIANSFGEDTDCTCATLGALMGILLGAEAIPEKWKTPLNDHISTSCIDKTNHEIRIPKTTQELTERILRVTPLFLGSKLCDLLSPSGITILCNEKESLSCIRTNIYSAHIATQNKNEDLSIGELCNLSPYITRHEFPSMKVFIDYNGSVYFKKGEPRKIKVRVYNALYLNQQQWVNIKAYMPSGIEMLSSDSVLMQLNNLNGDYAETEFEFSADALMESKLELIVSCSLEGRHSNANVKVTMLRKN